MTKHFVDASGKFLGSFQGPPVPPWSPGSDEEQAVIDEAWAVKTTAQAEAVAARYEKTVVAAARQQEAAAEAYEAAKAATVAAQEAEPDVREAAEKAEQEAQDTASHAPVIKAQSLATMARKVADVRKAYDKWLDDTVPPGAIEVPEAPADGRQVWDGGKWLPAAILPEQVDAERDRRTEAGLVYAGALIQSDARSQDAIMQQAQAAALAIAAGAEAGDLRWDDPEADYAWIAADNSPVPMDAQTVVGLARALARHERGLVNAARVLKEQDTIPPDYLDDKWWPDA